MKSLNYN